jgi:hypothetical protein
VLPNQTAVVVQTQTNGPTDHDRRNRQMNESTLYDAAVPSNGGDPDTRPDPGTGLTASVETVDNDRAGLMLDAGVVR